jgi:hypothetical protein
MAKAEGVDSAGDGPREAAKEKNNNSRKMDPQPRGDDKKKHQE